MMWEPRNIEKITQRALIDYFGATMGESMFADYVTARSVLLQGVLPEIRGTQPGLTDHGAPHISNVMDNAEALLGTEAEILKSLTAAELYSLLMAILFHDTGNIFDRKEHQRRIAAVYDWARPSAHPKRDEKYIVLEAVKAHAGQAPDGSYDTLKGLDPYHLNRKSVNLRSVAAVLRFADELAEGPQRTSTFMQQYIGLPPDSQIYHDYANIVSVVIDRPNGRIALTYDIKIESTGFTVEEENALLTLLHFTYKRIMKLDQERQYARHYCDLLTAFKATTVAFNFWVDGEPADLGLTEARLTGVVVPGDYHKAFTDYHPAYNVDELVKKIRSKIEAPANGTNSAGAKMKNPSGYNNDVPQKHSSQSTDFLKKVAQKLFKW